jgi:hypothetical protein
MIENEVDPQVDEHVCGHCGAKFKAKRPWQILRPTWRYADWDKRNPRQRARIE